MKERRPKLLSTDINSIYNLGLLHKRLGNFTEAKEQFKKALALKPDEGRFWVALGNANRSMGDIRSAVDNYFKAVSIEPQNAKLFSNLGYLLGKLGSYQEARRCLDKAVVLDPGNSYARCNRYRILLKMGEFKDGFAEFESRLAFPEYDKMYKWMEHLPRWRGESFTGKRLLVHHEQGFGDAIMFCRYLPMVKARGGQVILSTPKPLLRLVASLQGVDEIIEHTEAAIIESKADITVSVMSLPAIFGTTLDDVPNTTPYLYPVTGLKRSWGQRINKQIFNIGLVWTANPLHTWEPLDARSCGLAAFAPLSKLSGVRFYSLQKGQAACEVRTPPPGLDIIDYTDQLSDFAITAALIAHLDLVISVDTAVTHLSGALGKPVWTLLPFDAEWRWGITREDSPWYPTMRLIRQSKTGDWTGVMERVVNELRKLLKKH